MKETTIRRCVVLPGLALLVALVCAVSLSGCFGKRKQVRKSLITSSADLMQLQVTPTDDTSTTETTTTTKSGKTKKTKQEILDHATSFKYKMIIYTGSQSAVVYAKNSSGEYTRIIKAITVSTGKGSTPTRAGSYFIRYKARWHVLMGGVYGQYCSSISKDYLIHSIPYETQDPARLEIYEYDKLGSPASHGCIRMCCRDSKWVYDNVPVGTVVEVVNASGPKGAPVPPRAEEGWYNYWDPTDQWSKGNPYFTIKTNPPATTTTTQAVSSEESSEASSDSSSEPAASSETQPASSETPSEGDGE